MLRTAAFEIKQRKLDICAQRRDVVTDVGTVLPGLGDKLPVVAGFIAAARFEGWQHGRSGGGYVGIRYYMLSEVEIPHDSLRH